MVELQNEEGPFSIAPLSDAHDFLYPCHIPYYYMLHSIILCTCEYIKKTLKGTAK